MADTTPSSHESSPDGHEGDGHKRRDFLTLATGALGVWGAGAFLWPFVDMLNPAADVLAMATIDVDLAQLSEGQAITVTWQGSPVFVRYRTPEEIEAARSVDVDSLRDPEPDKARVKEKEYLITVGVCTHLGCIPLGQKDGEPKGDYGGWFCPCHGSHYDTSGRIRKGPAPKNLPVPPYSFTGDTVVTIG